MSKPTSNSRILTGFEVNVFNQIPLVALECKSCTNKNEMPKIKKLVKVRTYLSKKIDTKNCRFIYVTLDPDKKFEALDYFESNYKIVIKCQEIEEFLLNNEDIVSIIQQKFFNFTFNHLTIHILLQSLVFGSIFKPSQIDFIPFQIGIGTVIGVIFTFFTVTWMQ